MTTVLLVAYLVVAYIVGRGAVLSVFRDGLDVNDPIDQIFAAIIGIVIAAIWPLALLALGLVLWASAKADKDANS